MTQQPEEHDQDSEPTQKAPEDGRPDGTVAEDRPAEAKQQNGSPE